MSIKSLNLWQFCSFAYNRGVQFSLPHQEQFERVFDELEISPGQKILDAGCGVGLLETIISSRNTPNLKIDALDFSPRMIFYAKKRNNKKIDVNFFTHNLEEKLPYNNNYFDRVVSINVLFSVSNPFFVLKEFFRVLKKNSKVIIVDPKPNANMGKAVIAHFKIIKESTSGIMKIKYYILSLVRLPFGLIILFLNLIMNHWVKKEKYHFLSDNLYNEYLSDIGFKNIKIDNILANQDWIIVANK